LRILQGRVTMLPGKTCSLLMRAFAFQPCANCAKDGAPTVVLIPGRSNASATCPLRSFCGADECVRRYVNNIDERMRSHRNPVKRGRVSSGGAMAVEQLCFYLLDEAGPVRVNKGWTKISFRVPAA